MSAFNLDLSYVTRVNRQPLYFSSNDATLFGWLHLPRETPSSNFGMVLCPPLGIDYVNTYPTLRHLADRLAAAGIPVLRFDYSGTGNSSGFDVDSDRVKNWISDICTACETLQRMSGCTRTGLFGVRIGALLATAAAQEYPVECLALWGPVMRGRAYMREMRAMYLTAEGTDALADSGDIEAGGFVFSAQTSHHLSELTLDQLQPQAAHILFAARDDLPADQSVPTHWSSNQRRIEARTLPEFSGMLVSPHNSQYRYPHAALLELERWIADVAITTPGAPATVHPERRTHAEFRGDVNSAHAEVRESIFQFEKHQARFALISEPLKPATSQAPWIVLLNSGALHTAGPNRLYTILARVLARAGMHCVRMDFPGVGDSVITPPGIENSSYQTSSSDEIALLLTALQHERGAKQFVVTGLCSGAFASFHGMLDLKRLPIVEGILINPLTFYWKEGMSVDDPPSVTRIAQRQIEQLNLWQYYLGRMRDVRSWKNLLSAQSDARQLLHAILLRVWAITTERAQSLSGFMRDSAIMDDPLARDIHALIESGRSLTFVFARSDPGYGLLMTHAGATVRRFLGKSRIHIGFVERANHTFTSRASRNDFISLVVEHLHERYPPSGSTIAHRHTRAE